MFPTFPCIFHLLVLAKRSIYYKVLVRYDIVTQEAVEKNLNNVQNALLSKQLKHSSLKGAFVELQTYAEKIVAENSDLQAHVTHLMTTLEMQQQPIQ